ncbi:glycosyltransferase 87 family protein [Actinokineospora iranica]|uniref:Alpha-1,2-mannosyltransferase n=1 Tax=Actinokineospora iranica TaxID=1271860 RepID=A0A1G6VC25_9PSEU|nr:glycosyltransferase 87 family protein [Actinokineospora iranica]SDD51260.1 alpha-1,2-mannosyltransferase [Actinokineospora iranica]
MVTAVKSHSTVARPRALPGSVTWLAGAGMILLIALYVYHAWGIRWVPLRSALTDFWSYVAAGQAVLDGAPLYEEGKAALPTIGGTFKYTPFAAVLFVPLVGIPVSVAPALVLGANVFALLAVVWTGWAMLGHARDHGRLAATAALGALSLGLQPVLWNNTWGQVNLILMAMVVLDLALPDHHRAKGALVGVAAGIKLVPGIFIVYLLLTRRFRAAAVSASAVAATVGVGFLVLPGESWRFWTGNVADANRIVGSAFTLGSENQTLRGVIGRALGDAEPPALLWLSVAGLVAVVALAVAVLASRQGNELLAVATVGVTGVLIAPMGWSHYWVWFVPFLVLGAHAAYVNRSRLMLASTAAGYLLLFAWPIGTNIGLPFPGLLFAKDGLPDTAVTALQSLHVTVGLVLLASAAVHVVGQAADRPRDLAPGFAAGRVLQ